jgi:hypothetical protein
MTGSKDILVAKRKQAGLIRMKVKKRRGSNKSWDVSYNNIIDVKDYKALARFFGDLQMMFDAPVDKAFREMKKKKGPFW